MADAHQQANSPRKASSGKPTFCAPANLDQVLLRSAGTRQAEIIAFLYSPEAWSDMPEAVKLVETHMALLFFAGDRAYKMKRAVQLKHMDMRLLGTRITFCRREVELNRQLAPNVYLGTVDVTREADGTLAISGAGEPLEPLVIMRRLDVQQGLVQRILHGGVTSSGGAPSAVRLARSRSPGQRRAPRRIVSAPDRGTSPASGSPMTKDELRAVILEEIAAIAPEGAGMPVGDDDDLREVLDLDSMDIFNLVVAASTRLGVEISEADVGKLTTLSGGTDFLGSLVQ